MKSICINCSSQNLKKYFLKYDVYLCKKCKLYFCNEAQFNKDFESVLNEEYRVNAIQNLRRKNYSIIIKRIKSILKNNKLTGIEIGSSYGWFLDIAKQNKIECNGIEPERISYNISIQNGYDVVNGYYPDVFPEEKKDFIIFNDVFEHIPDLNAVMLMNYLKLKNDGLLIVNLPVSSGLFFHIAKIMSYFGENSLFNRLWQFDFHSPHYYYFNKTNLISFVGKYNFELSDHHPVDVIDFDSLEDRFKMNGNIDFYAKILIYIAKKVRFVFKFFPSDTECFYFKKKDIING